MKNMAWPVGASEENDSPENVTSSTDHLNEPPRGISRVNAEGASGLPLPNERRHSYPQILLHMREHRVPNPYIRRITNVRRYSTGDVNQSNTRQASGSNETNNGQRHSVPCCHMNPNMLHSCCLHLNRHRRNSFPQNGMQRSYNPDTGFGCTTMHNILNPHGQVSASEIQNSDYELRRSFSVQNSLLFWNDNCQADRNIHQALSAVGPEVFIRVLAGEIDRQGLELPEHMSREVSRSSDVPESLIYLINRFSQSLEREMVSYLALRVNLPHSLSCFVAIVDGMNQTNRKPEQIITLLFFCADMATRVLREGNATLFYEIVSWTRWYLRRSNLLVDVPSKRPSYKIAIAAACVGLLAFLFIMKRN